MRQENRIRRLCAMLVIAVAFSPALANAANKSKFHGKTNMKCWTNSEGVRECGNAIPPEYAQEEHVEKNASGLTVHTQGRAKTREEIVAEREKLAAEASAKAAAEEKAHKQAAADRVLLDTFSSEDDLVLARDGQLANVESQVKLTESRVKKLDKSLDQMIRQAADIEKRKRDVPDDLTHNIADLRQQIDDQKTFIVTKRTEQETIRSKFDADIRRFRELRAASAVTSK